MPTGVVGGCQSGRNPFLRVFIEFSTLQTIYLDNVSRIGYIPGEMPKNTKVHRMAKAIMRRGLPEGRAIAIAQAKTGKSYKTGRKPKARSKRKR